MANKSFHIDEYIEPVPEPIDYKPVYILEPDGLLPVRKEVHTRTVFAHNKGVEYFNRMRHRLRDGNIMSSKDTRKFLKARRIYIHYTNEYHNCRKLQLSH